MALLLFFLSCESFLSYLVIPSKHLFVSAGSLPHTFYNCNLSYIKNNKKVLEVESATGDNEMKHYASIARNMDIADKYFRLYLRDVLKPYNLNTAEGTVLLSLYGKNETTESQIINSIHNHDCHTQDQIINELHYDRGVMTRTMKGLEEKKHVLRSNNPNDCRSYIFSLTKKHWILSPYLLTCFTNGIHFYLKGLIPIP